MPRLSRVARVCLGANSPTLASANPRRLWLSGSLSRCLGFMRARAYASGFFPVTDGASMRADDFFSCVKENP